MNKKQFRTLGKKLKKVKTWEKATHIAGKGLNTVGDIGIVVGTATGQPEIVAGAEALKVGGGVANKTSKILKKV
jgi:hypothetical protein